jgi:hypothetical protein
MQKQIRYAAAEWRTEWRKSLPQLQNSSIRGVRGETMTSAERSRKWRLTHVVEKKLYDGAWREENPERCREMGSAWRTRNKDAVNERRRARRMELKCL